MFHKNNNTFTKAKVKPPRLNGKRVGVFSTRSPYRPNPVGLTLAKLEKIEGTGSSSILFDLFILFSMNCRGRHGRLSFGRWI